MESNQDRWKQLAALAAGEQDPKKLLSLVQELNAALDEERPLTSPAAEESSPEHVRAKG
jgi:hypothetical protein